MPTSRWATFANQIDGPRPSKLVRLDGGCSRARTYDPLIKSQLLYQLSYASISAAMWGNARAASTWLRPRD